MSGPCTCEVDSFYEHDGIVTCMKCGKSPRTRTCCDSIGPKRDGVNLRCTRPVAHTERCSTYWHGVITWERPGSLQVRERHHPDHLTKEQRRHLERKRNKAA